MRKWILGIWGAVVAFFGLFGVNLKLVADVNELNTIAALLVIGVWIFSEAKKDLAELYQGIVQSNKWSDPAFWLAAITSVVLPILGLFNITISAEIVSGAAALLSVLIPIIISLTRKRISR